MSAIETVTVNVTPVNDEPTLVATGVDPTFTEGDVAAADLFSGVMNVSTIESGQTFAAFTLRVTGLSDGTSEVLGIDGSTVTLTDGASVGGGTATNGLTVNVSEVVAGTVDVLVTGGTLDVAQLTAVIDGLSYTNGSEDPTGGARTATLTFLKDSGAHGGAAACL